MKSEDEIEEERKLSNLIAWTNKAINIETSKQKLKKNEKGQLDKS